MTQRPDFDAGLKALAQAAQAFGNKELEGLDPKVQIEYLSATTQLMRLQVRFQKLRAKFPPKDQG